GVDGHDLGDAARHAGGVDGDRHAGIRGARDLVGRDDRHGASAGALDVIDEQHPVAPVGEDEGVLDLGTALNRAEGEGALPQRQTGLRRAGREGTSPECERAPEEEESRPRHQNTQVHSDGMSCAVHAPSTQGLVTGSQGTPVCEHEPDWQVFTHELNGVVGSQISPSSTRPFPQLWRRLSGYPMGLDWNESPLSLVPNAVAWTMSGSETNWLAARPTYSWRRQLKSSGDTSGNISMKTTFGAPLSEVVSLLFTGFMRAPTNCVSCLN